MGLIIIPWILATLNAPTWVWICWGLFLAADIISALINN